jgi:small subunit ribosomal protein S17
MTASESLNIRGIRKRKIGVVVSDKMDKTVVIQIERLVSHPVYKKYVKRRNNVKAHDENNEYQIGDRVEIVETRPTSKDKRWRVNKLIDRPVVR